MKYKALKMSES